MEKPLFQDIEDFLKSKREVPQDLEQAPIHAITPRASIRQGGLTASDRMIFYSFSVPVSTVLITAGVDTFSKMGKTMEIISQNPQLLNNAPAESIVALPAAFLVGGFIFAAAIALDLAKGAQRIYRHFRPSV